VNCFAAGDEERRIDMSTGLHVDFESVDFERVIAHSPTYADAHVNLGIVLCTTADGRTCRSGSDVTDFIVPLIKMQGAYDDNPLNV